MHVVVGRLTDKTFSAFDIVSRMKFGLDENHISKALEEAVILWIQNEVGSLKDLDKLDYDQLEAK